jgi:hypothetical protein
MFCERCAESKISVEVDDRGNVIGPVVDINDEHTTGTCQVCGQEDDMFSLVEWTEEDDRIEYEIAEEESRQWDIAHQDQL